VTFQYYLKKAFQHIYKREDIPNPTGCSRTDADVHALEFVATMQNLLDIPEDGMKSALNSFLPPNIRVTKVEKEDGFRDARALATGKHYRYLIYNSSVLPPFLFPFVCHITYMPDIDMMKKAAPYFIGKHDFAAFMGRGSNIKSTERTIYDVKVEKVGNIIVIDVVGDGFLKHMVRIISGTLISAGIGRIMPESIMEIIASKDRHTAGRTLAGKGLYLYKLFKTVEEVQLYKIPPFSVDMLWKV